MSKKIIRLRRKGSKGYYIFEVVLSLKNKRNNSYYIEKLGYYNPNFSEKRFFINTCRLGYLLNNNALINSNVKKLISKFF